MRTPCCWALAGLCIALAACGEAPPLGPDAPEPAFGIQPEPFRVFAFQAAGRLDGRWSGFLGDPAAGPAGDLAVQAMRAEKRGATLYLVQSWTLAFPPDPIHPPDPVETVTATLHGTINLETGALVMNGKTADGDIVKVRGQVVDGGSGGFSIGGDVMFNPQPEPPGHVR